MGVNEKALLSTLIYSDLFDFPLTKDELYYYFASHTPVAKVGINRSLKLLKSRVSERQGLFYLKNREKIVPNRLKKEKINKEKMILADAVIRMLSKIPSVLFIGISGSLAVGNAEKEDDIDLFIIAQKRTLFTTRLLLLLFLELLGRRRKRNDQLSKDKICLNMLIDESSLALSNKRHDIYTAREIMQLMPLFDRGGTYNKFLLANSWTQQFLANAHGRQVLKEGRMHHLFPWILSLVEPICRYIQLRFIKRNQTIEEVSLSHLAFHPNDMRTSFLREYYERLSTSKIL